MSKVAVPGHDNPQTGPFFVEGAEPGDTLAVRILGLEPARSYAISAFSPGFGALVGNDQTAMLGPDLKEATWRYDVDAARKVARSTSGDGTSGGGRASSSDVGEHGLDILTLEGLGEEGSPDRLDLDVGSLQEGLELVRLIFWIVEKGWRKG